MTIEGFDDLPEVAVFYELTKDYLRDIRTESSRKKIICEQFWEIFKSVLEAGALEDWDTARITITLGEWDVDET